jgi:intracellular sulfur oxidation DsrE/DsrF family protein
MFRLIVITTLLLIALTGISQPKPVKIIFDITSSDTLTQQTVVRHVAGMAKSYPDAELGVVIYGGALPMALTEKSTVKGAIESLKDNPRVSFQVCESAMKRHKISKDQLLKTMSTVPDAIMEIAIKQSEGWAYIKEVQY